MPSTDAAITGPARRPSLLLQLGRDGAAQVMNRLSPGEVEEITTEIVRLRSVDTETAETVLSEFQGLMTNGGAGVGGIGAAQSILESAMGHDHASQILGRLAEASVSQPFAFLADADPKLLLTFLVDEHPQTIALVLAHLRTDQASAILSGLDAQTAGRRRAADRRDGERGSRPGRAWSPTCCAAGRPRCCSRAAPAPGSAASNRWSTSSTGPTRPPSAPILESLEQQRPGAGRGDPQADVRLRRHRQLEDKGVQLVLRQVDNAVLAVALKGVATTVRDKVLGNVSERARENLERGDRARSGRNGLSQVRRGPGRRRADHPRRSSSPARSSCGGEATMSSSTDVVSAFHPARLRAGRGGRRRRAPRREPTGRTPRARAGSPGRRRAGRRELAAAARPRTRRLRQTGALAGRRRRSPRPCRLDRSARTPGARRPGRPRSSTPPSRWPRPSSARAGRGRGAGAGPARPAPRAGPARAGAAIRLRMNPDDLAALDRQPGARRRWPDATSRSSGALADSSRAGRSSWSPTPALRSGDAIAELDARRSTPRRQRAGPSPGAGPGMSSVVATRLQAAVLAARPVPTGRVRAVVGLVVHVEGLAAAVGELVRLGSADGEIRSAGRARRRGRLGVAGSLACMPLGPAARAPRRRPGRRTRPRAAGPGRPRPARPRARRPRPADRRRSGA